MEDQALKYRDFRLNDKRNEALYYLGFIFWPFMTLVAVLRHWNRPWAKNIFWIFCIFFGLTFIISPELADSARYADLLADYTRSDMNLRGLFKSLYSESSSYVDIVQPVITFLVSRVTRNPTVLFTVFAVIFGYFYSRNIWYVLGHIKGRLTMTVMLYLLTFALLNPIWNINGFRMWTAAQIFLYGALPYLFEGNYKRLIWSVISIFFHFSFMYPLAILFLFIFMKNRVNIYLGFFILTSFIKEIDLQAVGSALSFLPGFLQPRVSGYTNLDAAESIRIAGESINWYLPFSTKAIEWTIYGLTLFVYFSGRKYLKEKSELMTLYCFSLLIYGFTNIISLIPSGGRFLTISSGFMIIFFIMFLSSSPEIRGLKIVTFLTVPLLLFYCLVAMRIGTDYFGLMTIFGNPLYAIIEKDTVPLIEAVKRFL